ncbi:MAG: protein-L-isoaspartate O-methyltransferase [Gammaproteobacteria bacterium]|nr:protein-L-isoaspartate O-methyltransferase [Gammaproteobacteria bacterium]
MSKAVISTPTLSTAASDEQRETARYNMIEQQIRPWNVLDPRVLDTLAKVPRETFLEAKQQSLAFSDTSIPLPEGQSMLRPIAEGRLLQALQIKPNDTILEVGTGSGFLTACLATLGKQVLSIDIFPVFKTMAEKHLQKVAINNVEIRTQDAMADWLGDARFDVIVISGALPNIPEAYKNALNMGGRLFTITGTSPLMNADVVTRTAKKEWSQEFVYETDATYLVNSQPEQTFSFA